MSDDPRYRSSRWQKLRAAVLRRDPLCAYCRARGRAEAATTVDHIVPTARGGRFWDRDNLAPACASCNYSKADTPLDEWLAGGCGTDGFGSFWDEKNQTSLSAKDRMRPSLHTNLDS
ncbi:HNH endonuclease signature motif containing protein [Solidesulfovibrio alcoholivorans]|uniref:HNH endonuclease n=1 Tax=Solidesulfovibrio alcoholivorans TaxID=81406 RepID=UPI0006944135